MNPGGVPTTGNASNDCKPSTAGAVVAWNVVEADATNWGVDVTSLTLAGQVNVAPWTSNPTSMTVPNTQSGRRRQYQQHGRIDEPLAGRHRRHGRLQHGGRWWGPNWHSTAASSAHEWAVTDSVGTAAGGDWPQANTISTRYASPRPQALRRRRREPRCKAASIPEVGTWRTATVARWNAIPDTAGVAGSTRTSPVPLCWPG